MSKWKKRLNEQLIQIDDLRKFYQFDEKTLEKLKEVHERHPMSITKYYADLIDWNNPKDPIKLLAVPSESELIELGSYDTSGETDNTILTGLQHKYQTTALILATNVCMMYCRHCFRKRMVGYSHKEINQTTDQSIKYIKAHKEINNVLVSGGDSFSMSNQEIKKYLNELTKINHLKFIRFGTRIPVVFPHRITMDEDLLDILKTYSRIKEIIIVTHFNHPKEITPLSIEAIQMLKNAGCTIRNQAVLLKDVNNDPKIIADLFNQLTEIGVWPYYLFQCRPVRRGTHFQVTLEEGIRIVDEARKNLNGISKGFRYVMSHKRGKIEIIGCIDDDMIFKFHQAKDEEDANMMFKKSSFKRAVWLDESLNFMI